MGKLTMMRDSTASTASIEGSSAWSATVAPSGMIGGADSAAACAFTAVGATLGFAEARAARVLAALTPERAA